MRAFHLLHLLPLGAALSLHQPQHQTALTQPSTAASAALYNLTIALETLQENFFHPETGTYPTGIDWTIAVLGTHLSATTSTLSRHPLHRRTSTHYFSHLLSLYYGQDAASLHTQAYDDILWVVLHWLEASKTALLRKAVFPPHHWSGSEWHPVFAARALEFYNHAQQGWDTTLCAGGMVWSPWLEPYKNAVTNQLFIAASVGMYLHHPARNQTHLSNALMGWQWLKTSGMQNAHGLYTDGFHVSPNTNNTNAGRKCDLRSEMVYTYNQGILLSALRGLYEATAARGFLEEAFELVDAVVATPGSRGGVVVDGVLTERCDWGGYCSQNGQTFKGIWMHHFTLLCVPLVASSEPAGDIPPEVAAWHRRKCLSYAPFLIANAEAAWATRSSSGVVGPWWGAKEGTKEQQEKQEMGGAGMVDYLNPRTGEGLVHPRPLRKEKGGKKGDLNDRGRGRTVESHSGGLAALRAVVEVLG